MACSCLSAFFVLSLQIFSAQSRADPSIPTLPNFFSGYTESITNVEGSGLSVNVSRVRTKGFFVLCSLATWYIDSLTYYLSLTIYLSTSVDSAKLVVTSQFASQPGDFATQYYKASVVVSTRLKNTEGERSLVHYEINLKQQILMSSVGVERELQPGM